MSHYRAVCVLLVVVVAVQIVSAYAKPQCRVDADCDGCSKCARGYCVAPICHPSRPPSPRHCYTFEVCDEASGKACFWKENGSCECTDAGDCHDKHPGSSSCQCNKYKCECEGSEPECTTADDCLATAPANSTCECVNATCSCVTADPEECITADDCLATAPANSTCECVNATCSCVTGDPEQCTNHQQCSGHECGLGLCHEGACFSILPFCAEHPDSDCFDFELCNIETGQICNWKRNDQCECVADCDCITDDHPPGTICNCTADHRCNCTLPVGCDSSSSDAETQEAGPYRIQIFNKWGVVIVLTVGASFVVAMAVISFIAGRARGRFEAASASVSSATTTT